MNDAYLEAMFEHIRPYVLIDMTFQSWADLQDMYAMFDGI